jgi:hypothetical protein
VFIAKHRFPGRQSKPLQLLKVSAGTKAPGAAHGIGGLWCLLDQWPEHFFSMHIDE